MEKKDKKPLNRTEALFLLGFAVTYIILGVSVSIDVFSDTARSWFGIVTVGGGFLLLLYAIIGTISR